MGSTTKNKYNQLESRAQDRASTAQSGSIAKQLMYPYDLKESQDHPGLVVLFEINRLVAADVKPYENRLVDSGADTVLLRDATGKVSKEVSMYRAGRGSMRNTIHSKAAKQEGNYRKTEMTIVLPPPDQFQDSNVLNWRTTELGVLGRAEDLLTTSVGASLEQLSLSLPKALAAGLQNIGGPNGSDLIEIATGRKSNSYTELLFSGVNNRYFPFQWTFTPRSEGEAEIVRQIIHRFRWAASPELYNFSKDAKGENNSFFRAPYTFDISFVDLNEDGKISKWWPKISTCALTNISTNRTPNGEFSVLKDQAPTAITLELQFAEMIVLDKSDMEDFEQSH